jgi:hypothetical protein
MPSKTSTATRTATYTHTATRTPSKTPTATRSPKAALSLSSTQTPTNTPTPAAAKPSQDVHLPTKTSAPEPPKLQLDALEVLSIVIAVAGLLLTLFIGWVATNIGILGLVLNTLPEELKMKIWKLNNPTNSPHKSSGEGKKGNFE